MKETEFNNWMIAHPELAESTTINYTRYVRKIEETLGVNLDRITLIQFPEIIERINSSTFPSAAEHSLVNYRSGVSQYRDFKEWEEKQQAN